MFKYIVKFKHKNALRLIAAALAVAALGWIGWRTTHPKGLTFEHTGIATTVFWVGEEADAENAFISNTSSAWDTDWQQHFGGVDTPDERNGYFPAGFIPKENPFYVALPYNDIDEQGHRKPTAKQCPLARAENIASWCKNAWVAIRYQGKIAYAQWEDVGPMLDDDAAYVFGDAAPGNTFGAHAGLDVSPAVRDYLGLDGDDLTDWTFVDEDDVPDGPWYRIATRSVGDSIAR